MSVNELLAEVERENRQEREKRRSAALAAGGSLPEAPQEEEEEEDYIGVKPIIEKWEKRKEKELAVPDHQWEPSDTDSDDEDERYSHPAIKRRVDQWEKKCKSHAEVLREFTGADNFEDAHKWMTKIDKFEERHLKLPFEYRVIGDMMNRLKESTGKERFILLQKLNRAMRIMERKEAYDPNNPEAYGLMQFRRRRLNAEDTYKERKLIEGAAVEVEDDEDDFSGLAERDDELQDRLDSIEKKIEEKLEQLDYTFGKKGRAIEAEVKVLVEERNSLTEKTKKILYRKGFDAKVINVNRTVKVTKGGRIVTFTALVAAGNKQGVVGFAKGKGPRAKMAIQKAYEKCFQNLHYIDRYEDHTIAHAIQAKYEKTKIYLWPGPTRSGMSAAMNSVEVVLVLAGFCNVKSKIIGSRNPLNIMKAVFIALNAVESPKDVEEKFGRTVVEAHLV